MYGAIREEDEATSVQSSSFQVSVTNLQPAGSTLARSPTVEDEGLNFKERFCYYVPCCNWMMVYTSQDFFYDLLAGLSLASYQIPLSMSFATAVAHVQPVCGLLGLSIAPIVYMFMGTVPQMIVGPEAAVSMIVGQCIEKTVKHNPDVSSIDILIVLTSCSGAILLAFGLLRFGFIDNILCGSLLKAFITAIGLTMMINSSISILGLDEILNKLPSEIHVHSPYQKIVFLIEHIQDYHKATAIIGSVTFFILFLLKYLKKVCERRKIRFASFFPEILVVVVFATFLSAAFDFKHHGIDVLGKVNVEGFHFRLPFTSSLRPWYGELFGVSFTCAILGFFESSTAGKSLNSSLIPMSSNRELVALGSVGIAVSLFGALPSFGGYARSKLNAMNGARTPAAGLCMGLTTLLVTFFLMDYIYYLPLCVLNAVIAIVGVSLVQETPKEVRFHIHTRGYNELFTFFISLTAAFFYSIELGVAIGTFYSLMRVVKHSTKSRIQILARVAGTDTFVNSDFIDSKESHSLLPKKVVVKGYNEFRRQSMLDRGLAADVLEVAKSGVTDVTENVIVEEQTDLQPELEDREGCLIIKIPEPLTFTNASDLKSRLKRVELYGSTKAHPGSKLTDSKLRHIVFDLNGMTSLDSSAAQILAEIIQNYRKRGVTVFFCRVFRSNKLFKRLDDSGIRALLEDHPGSQYGIVQTFSPYYDRILDALKAIDFIEGSVDTDVISFCSSIQYDGTV
ncbi:DEKNAAC100048 [Brettanomyces naardenensis]|uniref:DEKNAAC100048 n=1 Tax=Brettanomyces naardenensis TaxID=13370 RepID=A0A448YEW7_BRENA|nr:DEKNAAC100048 [Brettanomyces naardenensis]